jgi:nucleoside-diphosphate-sugar epimerase
VSRVLVTGASGFIGSRVVPLLEARGHEVVAVASRDECDLLAAGAAEELCARVRPQLLLHLAWYAEHGSFWTSPENLRWVDATLRLLRAFGGRRAVVAGTCAEYLWGADDVLREHETPLEPATLYGAAKHGTHVVARALARQEDFELAWGRIFFLYGPGEHPGRLVSSVARGLLAGERVATTPGTQVRDFMHVDDVAAAFAALLDSEVAGAVNIASGEGVAVREVIELVARAAGRPELVDFGARELAAGEPASVVADIARLRDEVGFVPRTELAPGLAATVESWRDG